MRSHKLIRGSFLNTLNIIAQIASGFYVMPLLVHTFGDAQFGIWILVSSFMGYAAVFDLGLPSAVSRFISQAIGRGGYDHKNEIKNITSTAFYIFVLITLITILFIGTIIFFAPKILKDASYVELFTKLLLILCINNFFVFPTSIFEGVLSANLRHDLINSWKAVFTVVRLFATILIVKSQGSLIEIAWATVVCNILENLNRVSQCYKIGQHVSISIRDFKTDMVRQLFGYSVYTFIGRIADMLRFQINSLVISTTGNVAQITPFRVAGRLIEYYVQLIGGLTGVFSSYFSQEEGKNNFQVIREKFLFINKIIGYVAAFIGGTLVLLGKDFILRWMGPNYSISYTILVILGVPMIFALMQSAVFPLLYGISKHKFAAFTNVLEGVLNLIISLVLVQKMGLIGVALGQAIPMVLTKMIVQPFYVTKVLGISFKEYIGNISGPFLRSLITMLGLWIFIGPHVRPDYKNLIFFAVLQFIAFMAMVLIFGFNKQEKKYIWNIVRKR